MAIITAENLHKIYPNGTRALNGINVTIESGEMVGILGSSGAGKTTFMRLLNGSIKPSAGKLRVLDYALEGQLSPAQLRRLRGQVGAIYQNHNVIPSLSVVQNVLMGRLGRDNVFQSLLNYVYLDAPKRREAYQALIRVGLDDKFYERAEDLSGGQQQRVAVARVLLQNPRILLADEPIASVDSRTATNLLEAFAELNRENKVTVIMNLHQVDFALRYCQRILVFQNGKITYDGAPEGVAPAAIYIK
jgi:phosphonate transport system ATP-binding protein